MSLIKQTLSLKGPCPVGSYMSTSMSLRPKRDLQFSHCVCDASLAAIKKSSYELDVPFCALCVLALLLQKKALVEIASATLYVGRLS